MKNVKIILPAREIPLGSVVTKTKGTAQYVLQNRLIVYPVDEGKKARLARKERGEPGPSAQSIEAEPGVLFLVGFDESGAGKANAIPADRELIWLADPRAVVAVLERTPYDDWDICPLCGREDDQ